MMLRLWLPERLMTASRNAVKWLANADRTQWSTCRYYHVSPHTNQHSKAEGALVLYSQGAWAEEQAQRGFGRTSHGAFHIAARRAAGVCEMAIEQPRLQMLHFDHLQLPIHFPFFSVTPRSTRSSAGSVSRQRCNMSVVKSCAHMVSIKELTSSWCSILPTSCPNGAVQVVYIVSRYCRPKSAYLAAALPLALDSRPALMRSRMDSRSLSSLSLVMTTLEGWMPRGTDWPEVFSRVTRST